MAALDFLKKTPGLVRMGAILLLGVFLLIFASGAQKKAEGTQTDGSLSEYGAALEARLLALCSEVEGAGEVRVMVTFASGEEALYQGSVQIGSEPPQVMGICVLCTGGADSGVQAALTEMLGALFGIGSHRISVLPLAR